MGIIFSLAAVVVLMLIAWMAGEVESLQYFFGIIIPYIAFAAFLIGILVRVVKWGRAPVPFRITTTTGQQKSLDFIKQNKIDNPFTGFQTFMRMALEVLAFRSLFRNTKAEFKDSSKLTYGASKWLWGFSLVFHYSFLVIVLRHFRFFTDPVPAFVDIIQQLDGFFQVGLPIFYMTTIGLLVGVGYLLWRRFFDAKVKYISLPADYFPLFLILAIGLSGFWIRHIDKVNLVSIKQLTVGIISFNPVLPQGLEVSFFIHFFLVCVLLMYFPMSKLVHAPGIFLSPTRNMANNNRAKRHVNPWNDDFKMHTHTYEEYEDEFREVMRSVGLPLEKEDENVK